MYFFLEKSRNKHTNKSNGTKKPLELLISNLKSTKNTRKILHKMKWRPHIDVLTEVERSHFQVPEKFKKIDITGQRISTYRFIYC